MGPRMRTSHKFLQRLSGVVIGSVLRLSCTSTSLRMRLHLTALIDDPIPDGTRTLCFQTLSPWSEL